MKAKPVPETNPRNFEEMFSTRQKTWNTKPFTTNVIKQNQGVSQALFDDVIRNFQLGLGVFSMLSFIEENSGLFYITWENCLFFFFREDAFYIVQACVFDYFPILSRSVTIFHISLSIIYQLYLVQIYIIFL